MAQACARIDSGLDKAKISSDRRVDADRPRLRAVLGEEKRFYTVWTHFGHRDNLSSSRLSFESEGTTRFEGIVGAAAALGNSVG